MPQAGCLTPSGVQQLRPLDEAQVAGAGPQRLGLPEAERGVEVVRLQALLAVDGVVAAGAVGAAHPDLHTQPPPHGQGSHGAHMGLSWFGFKCRANVPAVPFGQLFWRSFMNTLNLWENDNPGTYDNKESRFGQHVPAHSPPQGGNLQEALWSQGSR